ncbi:oxygenase [Pontibacillus yanchengensis Y32]|uniref:Oxygenase n=2 Tax=Pontibacillus yanchengensis TaxID=462910 RepID=A0A0A2T814_9BACI|nr:oxygenase [Pontibacillus yanchengensis Y32]
MNNNNVSLFKEVMGNYPTGVTVITSVDSTGQPLGLTVNSFASVSIDPLLILWSIDKKVTSHSTFINAEKFTVNILSGEQSDICSLFASKDIDRFSNCDWDYSDHNLPVISGVAGVLHCRTFKTIDAGDHTILVGEVFDIQSNNKNPLLYHQRNFGSIPQSFYS